MNLIRDAVKMNVSLCMRKKTREKLKLLWCYELLFTPISRFPKKNWPWDNTKWVWIVMNEKFYLHQIQKRTEFTSTGSCWKRNSILASAHSYWWWKFDNYSYLPIVEFHLINSQCEHVISWLDIISTQLCANNLWFFVCGKEGNFSHEFSREFLMKLSDAEGFFNVIARLTSL